MATTVGGDGVLLFSDACANQADEIKLLNSTSTVVSSVSIDGTAWGTPSGITGVDLASSIEFTIGTGDVVAKVALYNNTNLLVVTDFSTTYSFPNGGVFELTSCNIEVGGTA